MISDCISYHIYRPSFKQKFLGLINTINLGRMYDARVEAKKLINSAINDYDKNSRHLKRVNIPFIVSELGELLERIAWEIRRQEEELELSNTVRQKPYYILKTGPSFDDNMEVDNINYSCVPCSGGRSGS